MKLGYLDYESLVCLGRFVDVFVYFFPFLDHNAFLSSLPTEVYGIVGMFCIMLQGLDPHIKKQRQKTS